MSEKRPTTRSSLDRDLRAIEDDMLRMGEMVDEAIQGSLRALAERDRGLAQQIVDGDARVNKLRFDIEEACLALMATQQPAAGDLRTVVAAMNVVGGLERMADHAAGNARI